MNTKHPILAALLLCAIAPWTGSGRTTTFPDKETIQVIETGYHHATLRWKDSVEWRHPWLIQRSTRPEFVTPVNLKENQAADNTGTGTFRWLGINADNYVDLDGLEEDADYYYRVAAVTNMTAYRKQGTKPEFSEWQYGRIKTEVLPEKRKQVYDVTLEKYGAVPGDGKNDYPAILSAYQDARKAKGGVIYLPEGVYDLWPEDKDVAIEDGLPVVRAGRSVSGALFSISSDNITFLGDSGENGEPATFVQLYLWGKIPMTQWLEVRNRDGSVKDVRRYHLFILQNVENFTLRNLDIDGGAVPVNTGKEWYSLDQKRYQWDISNKLLATWSHMQAKNVIVDNVDTRNWRGEVYYNGGGSQKFLLKNGSVSRTNSSTVSGSFDLELVNMVIRDSANAAIESALFERQTSPLSRYAYNQNHIARGCTFIGLDQSKEGFMKNLPGEKKSFGGWFVFNQGDTYQTVTDCVFKDYIRAAYAPWYECRNAFLYNATFLDPGQGPSNVFYTWTSGKKDYNLKGGFSEVLWLDNRLILHDSLPNYKNVLYSQPGGAARDSESPWVWEGFHIANGTGENLQINRFWVDTWWLPSGRQEAVFEDFTKDDSVRLHPQFITNTKPEKIHPDYKNFFAE